MKKPRNLPTLPPGTHLMKSGHVRYHSRTSGLRNRLYHRVEVERLIDETPYSIRLLLPFPYEVHHVDYNKQHNCPCNYLIVSQELHSAMTADRPKDDGGRFGRKFIPQWLPPKPQWELFPEEVPF